MVAKREVETPHVPPPSSRPVLPVASESATRGANPRGRRRLLGAVIASLVSLAVGLFFGLPARAPGAPFGLGAPPATDSGVGLTMGSPYGYSWSPDGTLTLEIWVYNGSGFFESMNCDVDVANQHGPVAKATFEAIDGVLSPRDEHATRLMFSPREIKKKFADLSNIQVSTTCNSHSV